MKRIFANDPVQATKTIQGVTVYIEWPKGSTRTYQRSGTQVLMHADYGYIPKTEGADGEELDVYVGDDVDSPFVFQLHQKDPDNTKYDENKYMIGFKSGEEAKETYLKHVPQNRFGGMEEMNWDNFKNLIYGNRDQQKKAYDSNSSYHTDTPPDSWYRVPGSGGNVPESKYEVGDRIHASGYTDNRQYTDEETDGVIVDSEFYDGRWSYQIDMLRKNEETGAVEQTGDKVWVTDDDISGTLTASLRQAVYLDREGQTLAVGDRVILSEDRDEKPLAHDSQILNVAELYENQEEGGSYVKAMREDGKIVRRLSTDFKKITGRRRRAMNRQGKDYNPYSDEWAATDANGVALAEGDVVKNAEPGPNDNPEETYEIIGYSYPQIKVKSTETGEVGFASPSGSVKVGSIKVAHQYSLDELESMPTISEGQMDDLKVDEDGTRVWLSRMTVEDGMPYENQVTVEKLNDGRWETVDQYPAREARLRVRSSMKKKSAADIENCTFSVKVEPDPENEGMSFVDMTCTGPNGQVGESNGWYNDEDAKHIQSIVYTNEGKFQGGESGDCADLCQDAFRQMAGAGGPEPDPFAGPSGMFAGAQNKKVVGAMTRQIKIGHDVFMKDIKMPGYVKMIEGGVITVANSTYGEKMYAVGDPDVVLVVRRHATNQDELRDLERMKERLTQQKPDAENDEQKESIRIRMEELDREIDRVDAKEAMENPRFWDKAAEEDISDGNTKKLRSPATKEIGDNGHEELEEFLPEGEPGEGAEYRHEISAEDSAAPTMGGMPENVEQAMDQPGIGPVKFAEESDVELDPDTFDNDKERAEIEKKLKKQEDADTEAEEGEGTDFNQGGFQSTAPFVGAPAMPGQVM